MAWTRKYLQYSNRYLDRTTYPRRKTARLAQAANETYMSTLQTSPPRTKCKISQPRGRSTYRGEACTIIYRLHLQLLACVYTIYSIEQTNPKNAQVLATSTVCPFDPPAQHYAPYVPRIYILLKLFLFHFSCYLLST